MNIVHIYTSPAEIPQNRKRRTQDAVHVHKECAFVRIPKGTVEGNSSVAIMCDLPQGKHLFLEVTMRNFEAVAAAFRGAEERDRQTDGRN